VSAAQVLEVVLERPPLLGSTRLVCVDGPAGSGKSTLARGLAGLAGCPVVRMDDLYPGWTGLFSVEPHVLGLLAPLAHGSPGRYRRYDWDAGRYAEEHEVAPPEVLVLDGVGAGNRAWAGWCSLLVWVEAAREVRFARGIERDGETVRAEWVAWTAEEDRLFAAEGTRERADLVITT
jgi:uridine kinase